MDKELFLRGLASLNGEITEKQIEQFVRYAALLKAWNQKMNLTAITDDAGIAQKHFLDSILPLYYLKIPENAEIVDVGTGAGFPGLPIKILRPDIQVTLMDALNKRITFLQTVTGTLQLQGVTCVHGRAEDLGRKPIYRERFDTVVSRAVAKLRILCEYCLPFVKMGGIFVALKAGNIEDELADARPMIGTLGGKVEKIIDAPLPETEIIRKLVVVKKTVPTPPQFPRRPNKIRV